MFVLRIANNNRNSTANWTCMRMRHHAIHRSLKTEANSVANAAYFMVHLKSIGDGAQILFLLLNGKWFEHFATLFRMSMTYTGQFVAAWIFAEWAPRVAWLVPNMQWRNETTTHEKKKKNEYGFKECSSGQHQHLVSPAACPTLAVMRSDRRPRWLRLLSQL